MTLVLNGTTGVSSVDGSASTPAIQGNDTNTGVFFPAADTVAIATGGTERARVDSSGNVGIGTSSPGAKLEVNAAANYVSARVNSSTTTIDLYANSSSSAAGLYTDDAIPILFWNSGTERARIDSSGNLLVGTTSSSGLLTVAQSSASAAAAYINASSASYTGNVCDVRTGTAAGTGYTLFAGTNSGGTAFQVLGNGNVRNTNNSYGAISDVKLKENIADATPKLEKLNQVRIVNYNLIGDTQKQIGVVAQELEQIFPGMVEESPDRDAEGNDLGTTTKSVKYSVFVPMLIKAIQEQQALITSLTARIAALEGAAQ